MDEIECVILEWCNEHYLLPLSMMSEAQMFVKQNFIDLSAEEKLSALGVYKWNNTDVRVFTLNGNAAKVDQYARLKIALLQMGENKIAVLFEKEAKQIKVKEAELTWVDPNKNLAELKQTRLTDKVILFRSGSLVLSEGR